MEEQLKTLKAQLQSNFYDRLVAGKISEARAALAFAANLLLEIKKILPQTIKDLEKKEPEISAELGALWQTFENNFYIMQSDAERELAAAQEAYSEDPEVWKELLSAAFKEKVEKLTSLLDGILNVLKKLKSVPAETLPKFDYSNNYIRKKAKDKLYSRHIEEIERVEDKIRRFLSRGLINREKVTQKINAGVWEGHYHAWLPDPMSDHRIVFSWDGKKGVFETIGTHDELGIA